MRVTDVFAVDDVARAITAEFGPDRAVAVTKAFAGVAAPARP